MPEGYIDPVALDRSLTALRGRASDDGLMDSLHQLLTATCKMFSASGAGLMMLDDGNMLCALAATDERGRLLEGRQEELGHGPCVDTVMFDRVTWTGDLGADDRWPELLPEIPQAGVRSVLGIPIRASGLAVGALNVYRDHVHEWADGEITALTSYGTLLEGLLRAALQAREREELAEQLQHALNSRVVIERAVGLLMGRQGVDAVTAFNELRDNARRERRKVADVAAEILNQ